MIVVNLSKKVGDIFSKNKGLTKIIKPTIKSVPKQESSVKQERPKIGRARVSVQNESLMLLNYKNQSIIVNKKVRRSTDKGMKVRPIKRNRRENPKELEYIRRIDAQMKTDKDILIRSLNKGVSNRIKKAKMRSFNTENFITWLINRNLERYAFERGHLLPNDVVEYIVQGKGESPYLIHLTRKILGKGWI